jgi:hypothetical protein
MIRYELIPHTIYKNSDKRKEMSKKKFERELKKEKTISIIDIPSM